MKAHTGDIHLTRVPAMASVMKQSSMPHNGTKRPTMRMTIRALVRA
jgi:hypothetical protein